METSYASDSTKIQRLRDKIEARSVHQNAQVTPDAIKEALRYNQLWIERHNDVRISLIDKKIYRESQGSKSIARLIDKLKKELTNFHTTHFAQKGFSSETKVKVKSK